MGNAKSSPDGRALCGITATQARTVETRVRALPTELTELSNALDGHLGTRLEHLTSMLQDVRTAMDLASCADRGATPLERRTDAAKLDALHAAVWRLHSKMRKAASNMRPVRLLPLGDSITDGGTMGRSYRYHLHGLLEGTGRRIEWVGSMAGVHDKRQGRNASSGVLVQGMKDWPPSAQRHEGHWGWTSRQILRGHERQPQRSLLGNWLRTLARAAELPDVALVHLGTNDLTRLSRPASTERVSAVVRRMGTIVQRLCTSNPRVHVILATPIPYCRFRTGSEADRAQAKARRREREAEYADGLYSVCRRQHGLSCSGETRIICVNMTTAVDCSQLIADGVHPARSGARRMAALWHRALAPLLAEMSTSPPR